MNTSHAFQPTEPQTGRLASQMPHHYFGRLIVIAATSCAGLATAQIPTGDWIPQGPAPIQDIANAGGVSGAWGVSPDYPCVGSIYATAPHPSDPNTIYVAAPNGGVWKTANATAALPTWVPLTDQVPSPSMSCIEFDPTDATHQTLVAGFGGYSSGNQSAPLLGILRTTDGGASWQRFTPTNLYGAHISAVAARGNVILAASSFYYSTPQRGLYRSVNGGTTFTNLAGAPASGLPAGEVNSLVGVPGHPNRFYAALQTNGIYRSDDLGATWVNISTGILNQISGCGTNTERILLATHNSGAGEVVYAALVNWPQRLKYIYALTNSGNNWTYVGQAGNAHEASFTHFSLGADPTNAALAYIGGNGFAVMRIDRTNTASPFTWLNCYNCPGLKSVHVDSHAITFDANGNLIEADDGGIYLLPRIDATTGVGGVGPDKGWRSLLGNLQTTEFYSIGYDPNANVLMGGTQDNGTPQQNSAASKAWTLRFGGDTGPVAVDSRSSPGHSVRFLGTGVMNSNSLRRLTYDSTGQLLTNDIAPSVMLGTRPFYQGSYAMELNAVNPHRMLFGLIGGMYESTNRADTIQLVGTNLFVTRYLSRMVYGGYLNGVPNPDVIWACGYNYPSNENPTVYLRTNLTGELLPTGLYQGETLGVVANPANWREAYVCTANGVFATTNAAATWSSITLNLQNGPRLRAIEFLPLPSGNALAVGADDGVYVMRLGVNPPRWTRLGAAMPRAIAYALRYDPDDQLLVVGTHGRGAWSIPLSSWPQASGPGMALDVRQASGNYIRAQFAPALNRDYTISAWINLRSGGKSYNPRVAVFSSTNCNGNAELVIRSATTNLNDPQYLELARCGSFDGMLSAVPVPLNQWVHIAVTVGPTLGGGGSVSNLVSYYINGAPAGASYYLNRNLSIGMNAALAYNDGADRKFDGLIDQVSIWGTAIAPASIPLTMAKQPTGNVIDGALVMNFNFDEGAGTNVTGLTSGSVVGTVTWSPSGGSFQTMPQLTARPAQNITANSANVTATFTANGAASGSSGYFDYGLTTNYGVSIPQPVTPRETPTLNGVNDFIATSQQVNNPQAFSIGLWFKTTSRNGGRLIGFGSTQTNASPLVDRQLYLGTDGLVRFGVYDTTFNAITGGTACNDGRWHHVAGTFSQAEGMRLYLDGIPVASKTTGAAFDYAGYWRIGWDAMANWPGASPNSYFAGAIAEVQIWNTVLSPEFIAANYDCQLSGTESGLVTYYHLDEGGVGNVLVTDSAPGGGQNLGYLYGEPTWTTTVDLPSCLSQTLVNLEPATTYHFRAVGINAVGTNFSADRTFTTLAPTLQGQLNGSDLQLTWPHPATGFLLEQSPAVAPPVWSVLPPPYFTNGNTIQTNLAPNGASEFFRLRRP